jgi:hypothetical protein
VYTVQPSISATLSGSALLTPHSRNNRRAASESSAAKRNRALGSRAITNSTDPLHRLQTPSKSTTASFTDLMIDREMDASRPLQPAGRQASLRQGNMLQSVPVSLSIVAVDSGNGSSPAVRFSEIMTSKIPLAAELTLFAGHFTIRTVQRSCIPQFAMRLIAPFRHDNRNPGVAVANCPEMFPITAAQLVLILDSISWQKMSTAVEPLSHLL